MAYMGNFMRNSDELQQEQHGNEEKCGDASAPVALRHKTRSGLWAEQLHMGQHSTPRRAPLRCSAEKTAVALVPPPGTLLSCGSGTQAAGDRMPALPT